MARYSATGPRPISLVQEEGIRPGPMDCGIDDRGRNRLRTACPRPVSLLRFHVSEGSCTVPVPSTGERDRRGELVRGTDGSFPKGRHFRINRLSGQRDRQCWEGSVLLGHHGGVAVLGLPAAGKQFFDLLVRQGRQSAQDIGQVVVRIKATATADRRRSHLIFYAEMPITPRSRREVWKRPICAYKARLPLSALWQCQCGQLNTESRLDRRLLCGAVAEVA